jgi:hypothetical protein
METLSQQELDSLRVLVKLRIRKYLDLPNSDHSFNVASRQYWERILNKLT